jgi:Predicted HD superfamily hydrolase
MIDVYSIEAWVKPLEQCVINEHDEMDHNDGSHDLSHLKRVSSKACSFAQAEGGSVLVTFAAGMLHDIISLPKNHPDAKKSSLYASQRAEILLLKLGFPKELIPRVCHAIHAHSFSAGVPPETIEAKCVQDADRLESLGALGLMRTFYTSGHFGSKLIDEHDPEGVSRKLNDKEFALDHFPLKLFTLEGTMKTGQGKILARRLSQLLHQFRKDLIDDQIRGNTTSDRFLIAKLYHSAGVLNLELFYPTDPFALSGREINPKKYALDQQLTIKSSYSRNFLNQLKSEL